MKDFLRRLTSRKFIAGAVSFGSLIAISFFDVDITLENQEKIIDILSWVSLLGFGGIAVEDSVKAVKNG